MYLKFESVEIEGFQSIGKALVNLDQQGVVLVRGINNYDSNASSNGSGKSSIFQSILYCIYGKTSDGISDPSNRYYNDGCCVKLKFSVDNQEYTIIRSNKHSKYKSTVKLFKGDEDISSRNKSDTDKMIKLDVMPISQDVFLSTVFLSQGFSGRLSVLTPSGRKERIEELTDTSKQVDEFRDKIMSVKNKYSDEYDSNSRSISYKSGTLDNIDRQIWSLESEIKRIDSLRPDGDPDELSKRISEIESLISELRNKEKTLTSEISSLSVSENTVRMKLDKISSDNKSIKHEIIDLKSGKPCPTCGRPMSDEPIDPKVIESKTEAIRSNLSEAGRLNESLSDFNKRISENKDVLSKVSSKISELSSELSSIRSRLDEILRFRDTTDDKKKVFELRSQIESINLEINELKENQSECESLRDVAHHCTSLVSKQFRGYLLQEVIQFMNSRLKFYSSMLFSNDSDIINLSVDSTKLDIYLGNALYDTLSGGERKKVDIALVLTQRDLALNISGMSCNLLILDEIIENCDQIATNAVLDMLSKAASDIESMFIISHNSYSMPYDTVLIVVKDENRVSQVMVS